MPVVPHRGTWIEIPVFQNHHHHDAVVPHRGTWIEISNLSPDLPQMQSYLTEVRGLKLYNRTGSTTYHVVPHRGTWIEIPVFTIVISPSYVVPHRGTWIEMIGSTPLHEMHWSYLTEVRGLK